MIKVGNVEIRKEGKKTGYFRVVPCAVRCHPLTVFTAETYERSKLDAV